MRGLALVLAAAMLAACSAAGPKFATLHPPPIAAEGGRVYVLRDSQSLYSAYSATIAIDGRVVGELRNGGFLRVDLPAGVKTITATALISDATARFDLAPGATVYIGVSPRPSDRLPLAGPLGDRPPFTIIHEGSVFFLSFLDGATALARLPALSLSE